MATVRSFEEFMASALYGPAGFYTRHGSAGRRGDFLTSPSVGPLFGAVVAKFLDEEWERLGRPDPFVVVDAGAGTGALARALLAAAPACGDAMRCVAVEISAAQRSHHDDGFESAADLPDRPFAGVIVANELLDNLPFRLVVHDDGWREAAVTLDGERPLEVLGPRLDPVPAVLPAAARLGARAPLIASAAGWVERALSRLLAGTLVVIDYTVDTTTELADRPWREWLRTYRGHQRGEHYLTEIGNQDITTDVPLDQLPAPTRRSSQAEWLRRHGIDELVAAGRRYWSEHAARPDLTALMMRSRIGEAEALCEPPGLGGFSVLEYVV